MVMGENGTAQSGNLQSQNDSPLVTGQEANRAEQTSKEKQGSTSSENARTYTQEEYNKAMEKVKSDLLAEAGRRYKPIEDENVTFKSQLATNQGLIKQYESQVAKLNSELDELAKANSDTQWWIKSKRENELERATLEKEKSDFLKTKEEFEKSSQADKERIARFDLEVLATNIADDYENGDGDKLFRAALGHKDQSAEGLHELAGLMWNKKAPEKQVQARQLNPDSGATNGGGLTDEQFIKLVAAPNSTIDIRTKENQERMVRLGLAQRR